MSLTNFTFKPAFSQPSWFFIFFDGAVTSVPVTISDQLAESGRLAAIVTSKGNSKACLYTRYGDFLAMREVFDAADVDSSGKIEGSEVGALIEKVAAEAEAMEAEPSVSELSSRMDAMDKKLDKLVRLLEK